MNKKKKIEFIALEFVVELNSKIGELRKKISGVTGDS